MSELMGRVKGQFEVETGCFTCRGLVDFELHGGQGRPAAEASSRLLAIARQARGLSGRQIAAAAVSRRPSLGGWIREAAESSHSGLDELAAEIGAVRQERDGHLRAARLRLAGECCALLEQLQREYAARRLAAAV